MSFSDEAVAVASAALAETALGISEAAMGSPLNATDVRPLAGISRVFFRPPQALIKLITPTLRTANNLTRPATMALHVRVGPGEWLQKFHRRFRRQSRKPASAAIMSCVHATRSIPKVIDESKQPGVLAS